LAQQRRQLSALMGLVVEQMAGEDPARSRPRDAVDAAGPGERLAHPGLREAGGRIQDVLVYGRACGAKLGKIAHTGAIVEHTMGRSEEGAHEGPALGVVHPAQTS